MANAPRKHTFIETMQKMFGLVTILLATKDQMKGETKVNLCETKGP